MAAPVTVIVAWDTEFYEKLPQLFPPADFRSYFVGNQKLIDETAFRNSSLQGAYFIFHHRGASGGPGLWAYVRLRRRQSECGILSGRQMESKFPLQSGVWRPGQALPSQSASAIRRSMPRDLKSGWWVSEPQVCTGCFRGQISVASNATAIPRETSRKRCKANIHAGPPREIRTTIVNVIAATR